MDRDVRLRLRLNESHEEVPDTPVGGMFDSSDEEPSLLETSQVPDTVDRSRVQKSLTTNSNLTFRPITSSTLLQTPFTFADVAKTKITPKSRKSKRMSTANDFIRMVCREEEEPETSVKVLQSKAKDKKSRRVSTSISERSQSSLLVEKAATRRTSLRRSSVNPQQQRVDNSMSEPVDATINSWSNFSSDSAKELVEQLKMQAAAEAGSSKSVKRKSQFKTPNSLKKRIMSDGSPMELINTKNATPVINRPNVTSVTPQSMILTSPAVMAPALPDPSTILQGTVLFIDYYSEKRYNISKSIAAQAVKLGAEIATKLGPTVTHLVFEDGSKPNFDKALKLKIFIVSIGWVEASRTNGRRMPETEHPPACYNKYSSPGPFRVRRHPSMQPKSLEEEFAAKEKSHKKKVRRLEKIEESKKPKSTVTDTKECGIENPAAPQSSLARILSKGGYSKDFSSGAPASTQSDVSPTESVLNSPLAERLLKKRLPVNRQAAESPELRLPLLDLSNETVRAEDTMEGIKSSLSSSRMNTQRHKLFSTQMSVLNETANESGPTLKEVACDNVHLKSQNPPTTQNKAKKKKPEMLPIPVKNTKAAPSNVNKKSKKKGESSLDNDFISSGKSGRGVIVCTAFDKIDHETLSQVINSLEGFSLAKTVSKATTHLVCGQKKRTMNVLKAINLGTWILSKHWIYTSLEEGAWVKEDPFEMNDFGSGATSVRQQREVFGSVFRNNLFEGVGPIYISARHAHVRDLRMLVELGGGQLVKLEKLAALVVGEACKVEHTDQPAPHCVQDKWIFDSCQHQIPLPFSDYPVI